MEPTDIQESLYSFPYHYLPTENPLKTWRVARSLHWGYEYLATLETVRNLTLKGQPERVLDFGCGDGRLIEELLRAGIPELIGVDHSEHALLYARAALYGHKNVQLLRELQEIDRSLSPINTIIAMEVLEHIPPHQVKQVIDRFYEIINQDGSLIISVPTTNIALNRKHYQHFTLRTLNEYIQGLFSLTECQFIHKVGFLSECIRKMVVNRFIITDNETWLRMTTYAYKRFIMKANAKTGAHLICKFRRD
jgi:2-polyprenyl-3-methyl-5-hydroxy-6-metoxy-1,4-benzoquinol methylase